MTDKTPERLCYVNCGLPLLECRCYRENFQHWPQPVSPAPEGYVPASVHAAVVAERDQLKAKLEARPEAAQVRVNESAKELPDLDRLNALLHYNPTTGLLFWKKRTPEMCNTSDPRGNVWASNQWNARYAGTQAFTSKDKNGYLHGKVDGMKYQAHRIIWKMCHGADPNIIDHINGDQSDNRIENLRSCTHAENCQNYEKPDGGTSKYRGVSWVERDQFYVAQISVEGSRKRLGTFKDEMEAAHAYDRAAMKYHGDFATLNFPQPNTVAQPDGWRDISTAPKDGRKFDCWCVSEDGLSSARFCDVQMRGDGSGFGFIQHQPDPKWYYLDARDTDVFPPWIPIAWIYAPLPPAPEKEG